MRFCACVGSREYGLPQKHKSGNRSVMNTIDCSSIRRNRLSSWILGRSKVGSKTYIVGGVEDHQEGPWTEPGSLLGCVQPYLHEFSGAPSVARRG